MCNTAHLWSWNHLIIISSPFIVYCELDFACIKIASLRNVFGQFFDLIDIVSVFSFKSFFFIKERHLHVEIKRRRRICIIKFKIFNLSSHPPPLLDAILCIIVCSHLYHHRIYSHILHLSLSSPLHAHLSSLWSTTLAIYHPHVEIALTVQTYYTPNNSNNKTSLSWM